MNAKLGWDTAVAAAERNQPTEDQAAVVRRLTYELDQQVQSNVGLHAQVAQLRAELVQVKARIRDLFTVAFNDEA